MRSHTMKGERFFTSVTRFTLHTSPLLHTTSKAHKWLWQHDRRRPSGRWAACHAVPPCTRLRATRSGGALHARRSENAVSPLRAQPRVIAPREELMPGRWWPRAGQRARRVRMDRCMCGGPRRWHAGSALHARELVRVLAGRSAPREEQGERAGRRRSELLARLRVPGRYQPREAYC